MLLSRSNSIRLAKSIVGNEESAAVQRVIQEDGYLGMGREVRDFEHELANFLGIPEERVYCVNSGTAALHLAVQAVTSPGDEVLVQSLTYVASFQAISAAGAVPVACEVLPSTLTLNLEDAARRITSKTKAVMPVHYASNPGNLDAVYDFARHHKLRVIEDAAHAFGCRYRDRLIGSFGDIVCFSFDGIKNITSGEGGALVTTDPDVASSVADARLLGVVKDTEKRFAGERSWEFDVIRQGYRYHMSNVMAAIGRVQLRRFQTEFAPRRVAMARCYRKNLLNVSGIHLLDTDLGAIIPHMQPICVSTTMRDALRHHLEQNQVATGIHYKPNHLLKFYGAGASSLEISERLYGELLSLPLHPDLQEDDVERVCRLIVEFMKENVCK